MSVLDSIDDLATDVLTVNRAQGAYDPNSGEFIPGTPSSFTISAVVQPAFNLNRVVGGSNLASRVDNEQAAEVRQLHTRTELRTRTPNNDPDLIINYEGTSWTVARVEKWIYDGETHYHCVISRQTGGAS